MRRNVVMFRILHFTRQGDRRKQVQENSVVVKFLLQVKASNNSFRISFLS